MINFLHPDMGIWEYDPKVFVTTIPGAGAFQYDFSHITNHAQYSGIYVGLTIDTSIAQIHTISSIRAGLETIRYGAGSIIGGGITPLREDFFLGKGDFMRFNIAGSAGGEVVRIMIAGFTRVCECRLPDQHFPAR